MLSSTPSTSIPLHRRCCFPMWKSPVRRSFQLCLVDGAVVAVPGKAVKLINQNSFKGSFIAVRNHSLKFHVAVRGSRLRPVYIFVNYNMPVNSCVLVAGLKLPLYGLFCLGMAGITGVNHGSLFFAFHHFKKGVLSLSCMGELGSKYISMNCRKSSLPSACSVNGFG